MTVSSRSTISVWRLNLQLRLIAYLNTQTVRTYSRTREELKKNHFAFCGYAKRFSRSQIGAIEVNSINHHRKGSNDTNNTQFSTVYTKEIELQLEFGTSRPPLVHSERNYSSPWSSVFVKRNRWSGQSLRSTERGLDIDQTSVWLPRVKFSLSRSAKWSGRHRGSNLHLNWQPSSSRDQVTKETFNSLFFLSFRKWRRRKFKKNDEEDEEGEMPIRSSRRRREGEESGTIRRERVVRRRRVRKRVNERKISINGEQWTIFSFSIWTIILISLNISLKLFLLALLFFSFNETTTNGNHRQSLLSFSLSLFLGNERRNTSSSSSSSPSVD